MKPFHMMAGAMLATTLATGAFAQANLTSETAGAGGIPGTANLSLGEFASAAGIANIQVATGQTLTNSLQNTAEGKTDIASTPFILPFLLSKGIGPYAKLGAEDGKALADNLAVLYTYRLGVFALYAYESKNFGGYEDIAGKVIYNGPPRGGALTNARGIIKIATGLDDGDGYTGLQVNWDQDVKTMTDGSSDAMMLPIGFPDARITQALAAGNMTMWSVPKDIWDSEGMQKYAKAPGSAAYVGTLEETPMPEGVTVVSEDGMFRGIATVGGDVVSTSMDEELAYQLTKVMLENLDAVYAKTPFMPNVGLGEIADLSVTGMCGPMPLKYHPGAVRAWEEAGYTVPDCAKP